MKKIFKQFNIFLIIFFVFSLSLFIFLFMNFLSVENNYMQINSSLISEQNTILQNDLTIEKFNKFTINQNLFTTLPNQNNITSWVQQIEIMSADANLKETLSFNNADLTKQGIVINSNTQSTNQYLTASVQLEGTYNNIYSFIEMLSKSIFYTKINSIQIQSLQGQVICTINLNLYISQND